MKTGEGVWAESTFVVCARGSDLEARVSAGEMLFGPAAKWTTRYLFANGGQFVFTKTRVGDLRVETVGWSATFSSREGR